ncbi:expressed unknown protein [Seminavis robusta]|uniref:Uncharacterized protein n=1 Tax=Seminavis robusta TaxID=568900 RepID=A0A9N8DEG9_9STRA|nr:expressed unknown protein [Seminavis robusta]|eukprot:Sro33_g021490.1 n/a (167) ;mRNA; f:91089-91589
MWSLNPAFYLQHAWAKTNSGWGKMSLVLFYLFIWLGILKCLYGLFDPTMMGRLTCFMKYTNSNDDIFFFMMARGCFLYGLAFLVYADKGGLHSWNVGFVTVVVLLWIWIAECTFSKMDKALYDECVGGMGNWVWVSIAWVLLTFIGIVVDEKKADNGTEAERSNLV